MSPADEYARRRADRTARHAQLDSLDERYSYARLAVFAVAALLAWRALAGDVSWLWLGLPLAAFAWLLVAHDRVLAERHAAARAVAFYERGLARVDDRWIGTGESGDRFRDDEHLYANDLDVFGRGSLFELLSIARTRAGEETLARWLTVPADPATIDARQRAIEELTPGLDMREALTLAGTEFRAGVDTEMLLAWATGPVMLQASWRRVAATVLTAGAVGAAGFWLATGATGPLVVVIALELLFFLPQRDRVKRVLHAAGQPARDLDVLAHVLEVIERERVAAPRLTELRRSLDTDGVPASAAIRRLHRLAALHDWQHNQFFAPIAALLLWGTHVAYATEAWRRSHAAHVSLWLAAVGEFEALSSLAAYRYEHPADPFPELLPAAGGPATFEAEALGHPLLPATRMVRNDVALAGDVRLLVISGSNMSGKSTLLRTVGVNTVLALAGAPVRASRLRLTPLAVGATLRIQDSLLEGRSRFFAEITRLRRLVDVATGPTPLLFLLDELFHGTNSGDRLIGATGVLSSLLDRGAIGLVTTHDLALTAIAEDLAPRARNAHFEDRFERGEITFDFRMRPGPVTRSNALALMRAVGLDVDAPHS